MESTTHVDASVQRRWDLISIISPAVLIVTWDLAVRWERVLSWGPACWRCYAASGCLSAVAWGAALLWIRSSPRTMRLLFGAVFVLSAAAAFGIQGYFYGQYASYATPEAITLGMHVHSSVLNQLRADWWNAARTVLLPMIGAVVVLALASKNRRRMSSSRHLLLVLSVFALGMEALVAPCPQPEQPASADHLFVHAFSRQVVSTMMGTPPRWKQPQARAAIFLPHLRARPARRRNVLLIIDESVRADVVCSVPSPSCENTPLMNEAAADRIGFSELRSNDSTTAISLAVLWSGVSPTVSASDWAKTPLLFDFAHAAGWRTGFISSQDLNFASARSLVADLPLDVFLEARDLVERHNIDLGAPDEITASRAVATVRKLREPFLLVVQFSNVHFPYRVDPNASPFQPSSDSKDPKQVQAFFNYYRNAVFLHDRAVAKLVSGVRALPAGARTVILYTSDHAEAFREHHQLGHTLSTFDEEIHVPGWVDAPEGTLTTSERDSLRAAAGTFAWHVDIAPTMLDLMGLYDDPGVRRFRNKMIGTSWLRGRTVHPVPLNNCAAMWGCAFNNWGLMRGSFKLQARAWDRHWRCYDVSKDPNERSDLGPDACGDMAYLANKIYGGLPHDIKK